MPGPRGGLLLGVPALEGVPGGDPLTATTAGGTHPAGMLSCSHSLYVPKGLEFELEIKPIELQPFMGW